MRSYALSAIGADRPGIIAAIAERLVSHGVNVTDSHMGILRGYFAMTLIVEGDADPALVEQDLGEVADRLGLEALTLREVHGGADATTATHVVSVYGADHPGILAAATGALAAAGANVCDLRTRLVEEDAVYVMVVDVALPDGVDEAAVRTALSAVGERQGVDVTLRTTDSDLL